MQNHDFIIYNCVFKLHKGYFFANLLKFSLTNAKCFEVCIYSLCIILLLKILINSLFKHNS